MKTIEQRAIEWLINGEVGVSSKTICSVMLGTVDTSRDDAWCEYSHPHDPDDFMRCRLLLKRIPEWRSELHRVAEIFPSWRYLVEYWDELDALYEEEVPNDKGRAPRLYARMNELIEKAR